MAIEQWSTALNLYLTGAIDWLDGSIPTSLVSRLMGREDFVNEPYLGTYFFRVNTTRPPLDDARVRKALSLVIPRRGHTIRHLEVHLSPSQSRAAPRDSSLRGAPPTRCPSVL